MSNEASLSNGSLGKLVAAVAATTASLGGVHAYFVVPGILRAAEKDARALFVTRGEFAQHEKSAERQLDLILRALNRIEDKMKKP